MYQEYPKFIKTGEDKDGNPIGVVIFSKDEEPKKETPTEKPKATRNKKEVK